MNKPKVSIYMAVYNREKYLAEALDSILTQTFRDFELIIVDDGSTDRSLGIAREYERCDSRIKIFPCPHRYVEKARNEAIRRTSPHSKYLMNHDSDDLSLPIKLEKLVEYLDAHPEIAIVGCFGERFYDNRNVVDLYKVQCSPESIRAVFGRQNQMIHSASLIRREVFDKIGGYREAYLFACEDYDFFCRALLAGFDLANIPEALHRIRLHPQSIYHINEIEYYPKLLRTVKGIQRNYRWRQFLRSNIRKWLLKD